MAVSPCSAGCSRIGDLQGHALTEAADHQLRLAIYTATHDVYVGLTAVALLIVVVVVMDFVAQIQAHLVSHQYESLLKKANLRGR